MIVHSKIISRINIIDSRKPLIKSVQAISISICTDSDSIFYIAFILIHVQALNLHLIRVPYLHVNKIFRFFVNSNQ